MTLPLSKFSGSAVRHFEKEARYDRHRNLVRALRTDGGVNPFAAARRGRHLPTDYP
jgi:hypothetical protein